MRYLTILFLLFAAMPSLADTRALELSFLTPIMDDDLASYGRLEVPAIDNLGIISDGDGEHLELRMFPNQAVVNKGNRAELSVDLPHEIGDTLVYEWRMRIPTDSEIDPQNRWWLLGQWHDQPDVRIGEEWNGFPERSPSIGFGYGHLNGQDVVSMSYGAPEQRAISHTPLSRDVWHNMRVVIHWSLGEDGWAQMFMDNMEVPFAEAAGRNMYNSYQHYWKLGMYRDRGIQVSSRIQLDDIHVYIAKD